MDTYECLSLVAYLGHTVVQLASSLVALIRMAEGNSAQNVQIHLLARDI